MGKNFNGAQLNSSPTITEKAGADIADCRNRIMKYDENGDVILAAAGTDIPAGIAIIEAGYNDISGAESGKAAAGDQIDLQIKDIGYVIAGEDITKGQEITAMEDGAAAVAKAGDFVLGFALSSVKKDGYCRVQISKYQKAASTAAAVTE